MSELLLVNLRLEVIGTGFGIAKVILTNSIRSTKCEKKLPNWIELLKVSMG